MRIIMILLMILSQTLRGQMNCTIFKDSVCVKACEMNIEAAKYQGLKHSQELFDQSIDLCPTIAYSYFEKGVPYLKQGLYKEWKQLTDKAVELDHQYLLNRGINQVQFIRNYEAGLADLNKLYAIQNRFDIGYSPSGEYHGQLIRAICYQKLGDVEQAIAIIEELTTTKNYAQGLFDYFHLGIAYLENEDLEKAKRAFDKQNEENEIAGTSFYYSKVFQKENNLEMEKKMLEKAQTLYQAGKVMSSNYCHYIDQVFQRDINKALAKLAE